MSDFERMAWDYSDSMREESIRKKKKALKREIRRIDTRILTSNSSAYDIWDLFLWRNYFERKIKDLNREYELCPWTGERILLSKNLKR